FQSLRPLSFFLLEWFLSNCARTIVLCLVLESHPLFSGKARLAYTSVPLTTEFSVGELNSFSLTVEEVLDTFPSTFNSSANTSDSHLDWISPSNLTTCCVEEGFFLCSIFLHKLILCRSTIPAAMRCSKYITKCDGFWRSLIWVL